MKLGLSALALGVWVTALGQSPAISSFSQNGELVCTNLMPGSVATVLEAPTVTGPWTTNAAAVSVTSNGTFQLSGLVSQTGSKFYRVLVNETNLSNDAWRALQASRLEDNQNYGRFLWTNTMAKIASGQNVKILLAGTGLVDMTPIGVFDQVAFSLTNKFPIAGCMTTFLSWWGVVSTSGTLGSHLKDTNWFTYYGVMDATDDWVIIRPSAQVPWNVLEVDYLEQPNGGLFAVLTNGVTTYGTYGPAFTINTFNSVRSAKTFYWTNTVALAGGIKVTNQTGTNIVLNYGIYNTNITGGVILAGRLAGS